MKISKRFPDVLHSSWLFWILIFIFYSLITAVIFSHRLQHPFSLYAMPDIDTDGGLWYQWYSIYNAQKGNISYITTLISYPFGFDMTFLPFSNLIYSIQVFVLDYIIGYSWQNLIFVTNISSLVTYPLSAMGAALLCNFLTKNRWASFIVGIIFSFSYYHVYMGRGQMSINHIEIIPFYFLSLFYFLHKKNFFSLIFSSLTFSILFNADAYYAFFSGIFSLIIFFFLFKGTWKEQIRYFIEYYFFLGMITILINFNFVLNNLYLFNHAQAVATGRNSIPKNELLSILFYFAPDKFNFLHNFLPLVSYFSVILIPLIITLGVVLLRKNKLYITFLACFLLAIVLTTYNKELYGINELYFHYFGMFRGVARMVLPAYLFIGLMVGIAITEFMKSILYKKGNKPLILILFILLSSLILLNSLNTDETWYRRTDMSKIAHLYDPIRKNSNIHVIATYPMTRDGIVTGCPETYQLMAQIIHNKSYACGASPFDPFSQKHYKAISNIEDPQTLEYLIKHNIDTILISNNMQKNATTINSRLQHDPRVLYLGRFTESADSGYISSSDKSRDISLYQLKPVLEQNKHSLPLFSINDPNASVTYHKISPTRYVISVKDLKQNDLLIFNSPFSEKWELYPSDLANLPDLSFFSLKNTLLAQHTRYNESANAWTYLTSQSTKLKTYTLYFSPKKIYSLGTLVSYCSFSIIVIYLLGNIFYVKFKK